MMETPQHKFDHHDPEHQREAKAHISRNDPHLAALVEKAIEFKLNVDEQQSPYDSLLRAIAYQSIAGKAAAVIFGRIKALGSNGRAPTPEELLRVPEQKLREAGLSGAKVAAVRDLAQKTIEGIVPTLAEAEKMTDAELIERLISVRGIGAWTVEMFLIFRLGRPDVLPIHDYAVQKGFALTYRKRRIPTPKELAKFGERWRPYRTLASWYMWRAVELAGKDARKITKKYASKKKRVPVKKQVIVKKRIVLKKRIVKRKLG
jgi:DNA-3-methyladenine glycosylase II